MLGFQARFQYQFRMIIFHAKFQIQIKSDFQTNFQGQIFWQYFHSFRPDLNAKFHGRVSGQNSFINLCTNFLGKKLD